MAQTITGKYISQDEVVWATDNGLCLITTNWNNGYESALWDDISHVRFGACTFHLGATSHEDALMDRGYKPPRYQVVAPMRVNVHEEL